MLMVDGKIVEVARTATGFRKTAFRGGPQNRRRLYQRQVCLPETLCAGVERRVGWARVGVSGLDARLQCKAHARKARELCSVDAHFAATGRTLWS